MHAWLIMHQNYFYFLFFFNSKQTGEINLRQLKIQAARLIIIAPIKY